MSKIYYKVDREVMRRKKEKTRAGKSLLYLYNGEIVNPHEIQKEMTSLHETVDHFK